MELSGRILTPEGFRVGRLRFGRRIEAFEPGEAGQSLLVLPGFVDAHVHGAGGGDAMSGEDSLRVALRAHARCGTTALAATTWTAPFELLERALVDVRSLVERPEPDGARVIGAHLEGPWISPRRLGAQPAHARPPESWEMERLLELGPVRVVTLAPEIEGGLELVERLVEAGVRVQIGHSEADAEIVREALDRGAAGFTHLFNAMSGFHHRTPGVVGAALASRGEAELILDDHHVGAEALEITRRCLPGWYCVSDAIAAAGMADGRYRLGDNEVAVVDGVGRLADGTLAGSTTTLHGSLLRLTERGLPLEDAVARVSTVPARALGVEDRGRLEPGCWADMVVVDEDLQILDVFIEGRRIDRSPAGGGQV